MEEEKLNPEFIEKMKKIKKEKNIKIDDFEKAKIKSSEFDIIFNLIFEKITIIPKDEYQKIY